MDLSLIRHQDGYRSDGIFSTLSQNDGSDKQVAVTVEHAYPVKPDGPYLPILPAGVYDCVRGMHRLEGMTEDFETFEITGVPGHTGVLFHWGNFNRSSHGCVCTGLKEVVGPEDYDKRDGPDHMVTYSRVTFEHFMEVQEGCDTFKLTVEA